MAKDSDDSGKPNSFTANDRRIRKRIDSKAGEMVVEKIELIRKIAGYVDKNLDDFLSRKTRPK